MTTNAPFSRQRRLRRIIAVGCIWLLLVYGLVVALGYSWLHYGLKNDRIGMTDVVFLRWHRIRKGMASEQFASARAAAQANRYQEAYLAYISGVRNDRDNVDGRLEAAQFLGSAGAVKQEITLLEDGLRRAPDNRQLIEQTFSLLTTTGRDRYALDLIHERHSSKVSDPNGPMLFTFEILATLNTEGATAADALLEKHPELKENAESAPVVARVFWETRRRLEAIDLLSTHVQLHPNDFFLYAQLAKWQAAGGLSGDALQTAKKACGQFPRDFAPRILTIEMTAEAQTLGSPECQKEIESYLIDFGGRPEAITMLANLAGEKGWVGLARVLYVVSAGRQPNLGDLALSYADALAKDAQLSDAQRVLTEIEGQTDDANVGFQRTLRRRQIEVAAARGDHDGAREYARRLMAVSGGDTDAIETFRRRFVKLGISEAVSELTRTSGIAKTP